VSIWWSAADVGGSKTGAISYWLGDLVVAGLHRHAELGELELGLEQQARIRSGIEPK